DGGRQVGDDVAEEVIGDDHVEAGGVGGHEDGGRIHVQIVDGDLGVFGRDGIHRAAPQVTGVDQHVVLVHEGELLARAGLGAGEGVAYHPLDAEGGVQADLGGHFVRGAHAHGAAVTHVRPLGAFADHDEVDLAGVGQGGGDSRQEAGGAQVDIVFQGEAQLQQQSALQHAGGDAGIADGAQQDGVVLAD